MTDSIKLPVEIEYHFHWENPSAVDAEKVRELSGTAESRPPTNDIRPMTADENRLPLTRLDILRLVVERYQQCVSKLLTLFPFDPLGESPAHFYIERLEALIDRKLLIPNLPLNPTSAPITREQTSAIRQLIRASYFNGPGLHSHVLLEVFDHLILEANCEFDECTCERDATAHSQDCPMVLHRCLKVPGGTIFPPADWPGWARTPDAHPPTTDDPGKSLTRDSRPPTTDDPGKSLTRDSRLPTSVDDRCTNCKEFDLDGCASCGPLTIAKVYGVDDSEVSRQSSAIGQSSCRLCSADPKPNSFASPRHCAFRSGTFHQDNWSCGTLDKVRETIFNGTNQAWHVTMFDESCAVLPIPNECKTCHGFLILAYYKDRGAVGKAIVLCEDLGPTVLNLAQAEDILAHLPSTDDLRPPTADSRHPTADNRQASEPKRNFASLKR